MGQTPLEDLKKMSDVIVDEYSREFCEDEIDVSAYDHSAVANKPEQLLGWLIKAGDVLALAADAANVTGIIVTQDKLVRSDDETTIINSNAKKFVALKRGPAIIKESGINLTDTADAAITLATVKTALLALDIKTIPDPLQTTTQSAH